MGFNRKIKILFFIHDLSYGGAEKVLVNLVNNLDTTKFDVTLQTMFDKGINKDRISSSVKYIPGLKFMFRGNSYFFKIFSRKFLYKKFINDKYDIVVSYLEGTPARIISGNMDNNTKTICWIHIQIDEISSYINGFRNIKEANASYATFDKIICVSQSVKESFEKINEFQVKNIDVLYHTNESDEIIKKSKEDVDIHFDKKIINICSVAKITESKGYDHLAHVHKKLIEEGLLHHIYIIGVGEQQKEIENYLIDNNLQDTFTFLGFQENPYKYISKCDLYVCSSHKEGFSTAVTEALIIGIPVVSTLCSGANELLGYNNEYGLVVENNEDGIYQGLKYMIQNPLELQKYKQLAKIRGQKFSKKATVSAVENMLIGMINK